MTMQGDKARLDEMRTALRTIIECNDEGPGLIDCIDNDGERYTSQGLDDAIKLGRQALESDALRSLRSTEGKEGAKTVAYLIDCPVPCLEFADVHVPDAAIPLVRRSDLEAAEASHKAARENFLTMQGSAAQLLSRAEAAEAHVAKLREALTPSGNTKAAYSGEFFERVEIANPMFEDIEDEEPETIMQSVPVSWTTIKAIMAAIEARAALTRSPE